MPALASLLLLACVPMLDAPTPRERIEQALADNRPRDALELIHRAAADLSELQRCTLAARAEIALLRWPAAKRSLIRAIELDPADPHNFLRLGRVHAALGADQLAVEQFEKAAWLGLDSPDLHLHWARALFRRGDPINPLQVVDGPHDAPAGTLLDAGVVLRPAPDSGRLVVAGRGSALYHARRALRLRPDDPEALLLCGDIWLAADMPRLAVIDLTAALRRCRPARRADCLDGLARALLDLGEYDEYFRRLRERMAVAGGLDRAELAAAYERVAASVALRGDLDRQIRYLRFAVEIDATPARHLALGDALQLAGRRADALDHYHRALAATSDPALRATLLNRLSQ